MDIIALIGRILFALIFLGSGSTGHIGQRKGMAQYASSQGVPAAEPLVVGSGVLILVGGLMVALGIWGDLGALLLAVFLLPTAFLMHAFWKETDAQARQMEMIQFQKDLALGGAALLIFALIVKLGPDLGLTITDPLFK